MILSNSAIFAALDEKRLVIDPEPTPRNPADDPDADWSYGSSAIDLRLGDEISWFNDGLV
jgi:dCTP deaminase